MITDEQRAESQLKRIATLREGFGSEHPEVKAWDAIHPAEVEVVTDSADRLTAEEVAVAVETVPPAGVAPEPAKGKIGGRRPADEP